LALQIPGKNPFLYLFSSFDMELVSLDSLRCLCCGALGFGFGIIDGNSSYDSLGATMLWGALRIGVFFTTKPFPVLG